MRRCLLTDCPVADSLNRGRNLGRAVSGETKDALVRAAEAPGRVLFFPVHLRRCAAHPTPARSPTICTAITLTMVIAGKIVEMLIRAQPRGQARGP
jgi:hypothetical protein